MYNKKVSIMLITVKATNITINFPNIFSLQTPYLFFINAFSLDIHINAAINNKHKRWHGRMIKMPVIIPPTPYKMIIIDTFKLRRYPLYASKKKFIGTIKTEHEVTNTIAITVA